MGSRKWANGPINGGYLRDCRRAELRKRSTNGTAAIGKPSTLAGKVVSVPPAPKCVTHLNGLVVEKPCG